MIDSAIYVGENQLPVRKRAGAVPGSVNHLSMEKGGELMEIYTLEIEVLEDKLAPIGVRVGGE
jgi:hypothetical protein